MCINIENTQYVYKYVRKYNISRFSVQNTEKDVKYTFTPGKFYLKNLNVLCPKVGFLNTLNDKPNKLC